MIKYVLLLPLILFFSIASAQIVEKPIQREAQQLKNKARQEIDTVLTLPFWDDFSSAAGRPSPLLWRFGQNVDVSATTGINPPTFNVAVFNGVDSLGVPYNLDDNTVVPVDSLVSQRIDLTQVPLNRTNSIFMSFFWQAGGNGEAPDLEDSFSLFFLDDQGEWIVQDITPLDGATISLNGGPDALRFSDEDPEELIFTQVNLRIPSQLMDDDPQFIHENFRFKFQANGNQQGTFDSWLIDYVYINFDRDINDIFYEDRALTAENSINFGGYKSIPFDHFFENRDELSTQVDFGFNNLDDQIQPIDFVVDVIDRRTGNLLLRSNDFDELLNENGLPPGPLERLSASSNVIEANQITGTAPDTMSLEIRTFIFSRDTIGPNEEVPPNFLSNDTITTTLDFENTYAYDDGSAEFSAGINVNGGQLAVEYVLLSEDTLTAIEMNLPILFPDADRQTIEIFVLRNLRDEVGSLAVAQNYQINRQILSVDSSLVNFLIPLREHKIFSDTIYIGFRQLTNEFIPVGLDKNNDNGDRIFFNVDNQWFQNNTVSGSLMIRPVFGTADPFIPTSTEDEVLTNPISIYPNPTTGLVYIEGEVEAIQVFNLSGQAMSFSQRNNGSTTIDLSSLERGIYLIRLLTNKQWVVRKIIKN